jgi:hypothetical protein
MGNAGVNINTYMKSFKKFLMEKGNQFMPYGYWRDFKIGEDGRIYYFDEPHDLDEPLPQEDWEVFNPNEAPTPYPTDLGWSTDFPDQRHLPHRTGHNPRMDNHQ